MPVVLQAFSAHQTFISPFLSSETQPVPLETQLQMFKPSVWSPGSSGLKPLGYLLIPRHCPKILILVPKENCFYLVLCSMPLKPGVLIQGKNMASWGLHKHVGQSISKSGPHADLPGKAMYVSLATASFLLPFQFTELLTCSRSLQRIPSILLRFICNSRRMLQDVKTSSLPQHQES